MTDIDRTIALWVEQGHTLAEIAEALGISLDPLTIIRNHMEGIQNDR